MAKFNIEVELDWIGEDGYSIDDEIKEQVVSGVKNELLKKTTDDIVKKLDSEIAKKLQESTKIIDQRVEDFVATVTEQQIQKIRIPYKENCWGSEVEFIPISEYVGMKYEEYLNRKIYDKDFNLARYDSDKYYSISEKSIREYLNKTLSAQVSEMVKKAQKEAEDTVLKTLEQNLQNQLTVDTIKRLNIPKLLEGLQKKALEYQNTEGGQKC